jgi:Tol biopolymer transport system component
VAFATERYHENIFLAKTEDGSKTQMTNSASRDRVPRWSPDGSRIAFQSDRSGKWEIWMMDRAGQQLHQLTRTVGQAVNPVWSPDGTQLAFTEMRVGIQFLDLRHPNTGSYPPVLTLPNTYDSRFFLAKSWSPDGHLLAGALHTADGTSNGIAIQHVTGGRIDVITNDGGESPAWLSDGARLVYRAAGQLKTVSLRDLQPRMLFPPGQYEADDSLGISSLGDYLFFTNLERQADIVVVAIKSY